MKKLNRREFLKIAGLGAAALATQGCTSVCRALARTETGRPNIILCMTDDQGWGDTGYNGHPHLKTPNLDAMSKQGIRFDRWYAAAPVCSPTRGSCLTGRHPFRYGIFSANIGHLRTQELTLAEALKTQGYRTGHFGKWHLGTMSPDYSGKGQKRKPAESYMTPAMSGFDEWFSTEFAVPTWDPYDPQNFRGKTGYDTRALYWHNGQNVTEKLRGDDSKIIMDRVVPFIRKAARNKKPFFAVIWFHTPHSPVIAGPEYRKIYSNCSEGEQHYYGCITAMDEQIGRLRAELGELAIADDTMLWFCSDNGPEGKDGRSGRHRGSAGPFRGRKRSLFEGGVRVPALLLWPAKIKKPRAVKAPCTTSDYYPTILDVLGFKPKTQPQPVDGISILPIIEGKTESRPAPIAFQFHGALSLTDNRYKLVKPGPVDAKKNFCRPQDVDKFMLFDLLADPAETKDISAEKPQILSSMKQTLEKWQASCRDSLSGKDYK